MGVILQRRQYTHAYINLYIYISNNWLDSKNKSTTCVYNVYMYNYKFVVCSLIVGADDTQKLRYRFGGSTFTNIYGVYISFN